MDRTVRVAIIAPVVIAASLAGCAIEDRTPTGSRRDEAEILRVLRDYQRGVDAGDTNAVRALFWPGAIVSGMWDGEIMRGVAAPVDSALPRWVSMRGRDAGPEYETTPLRTDTRQEGELASAWLTTRRREVASGAAAEWVEHAVLRRVGAEWRIVSLAVTQQAARQQ